MAVRDLAVVAYLAGGRQGRGYSAAIVANSRSGDGGKGRGSDALCERPPFHRTCVAHPAALTGRPFAFLTPVAFTIMLAKPLASALRALILYAAVHTEPLPPHSLRGFRMRPCAHIEAPPHFLH
jgi:hypothetical protein